MINSGTTCMKTVRDLDIFKLAHKLALSIYELTSRFPKQEAFHLVSQMRRAACSVGSNLVEGSMRLNTREYRHFVGIARGSAGEVRYQLLLAKDLTYIGKETYEGLESEYERVSQMLTRLEQSLRRKDSARTHMP